MAAMTITDDKHAANLYILETLAATTSLIQEMQAT
jgi:hypothetical protein